tara:strand:- start:183 stop:509 length:327 start_codon:yes stop_codon:yes gene_type:complete
MSGYGEVQRLRSDATVEECEDWYGLGDYRCAHGYVPTGDLITDITNLKERVEHYTHHIYVPVSPRSCVGELGGDKCPSKRIQIESGYYLMFKELLAEKEAELKKKLRN